MLAAPAFAAQTIWKWVDEKGVVHYSDRPVPGATKTEISSSSRWDSTTPAAYPSSTTPSAAAPAGPSYVELAITTPAPNENIVNSGGQVRVAISIAPQLQTGHTLSLYLDGALVEGFPPNTSTYDLEDVGRGAHSAMAVVTDEKGTRLQQSPPLTFHVRQASIAQPPVGPTLRPQPKPRN
jgi:hypothetical protein